MYIYCDRPSHSARALALAVPMRRVREGSSFNVPATVINWGHTEVGLAGKDRFKLLNPPEAVRKATDKLQFFQAMEGLKLTPRFYMTSAEASKAISDGKTIVCRTVLNGHSGNGVVIAATNQELVQASLYVDYIKKETEWRIHVFNEKVIDVQRKARDKAIPDDQVNWSVRSHANGFIYARGDIENYPKEFIEKLKSIAVQTVKHIQLDFGACDLIATEREKIYVLEVNTAPGLEGTTLTNYVNAIKELK